MSENQYIPTRKGAIIRMMTSIVVMFASYFASEFFPGPTGNFILIGGSVILGGLIGFAGMVELLAADFLVRK